MPDMRPPRRSLLLVAAVAVLLIGGAAWAGTADDPEIDDETGDMAGGSTESGEHVDLDQVWIVETESALEFHIQVASLGDQGGGERWDVNFAANGSDWAVRAEYDGSFSSQVQKDDGQFAAADTSVTTDDPVIVVEWTNYEDELANATLTDLYALTDDSDEPLDDALDPCHGENVIDCAPGDGEFGRDFEIGEEPAEGLSVNVTPNRTEADPGQNLTFNVTARNDDDDPVDGNYTVTAPDALNVTFNGTNVSLEPDGSDSRTLNVTVADDIADDRTYEVNVTFVPDVGKNRSALAEIFVPPPPPPPDPYGLTVTVSPGSETVEPGTSLEYTVEVTNDGAENDTVDLTLEGGPGWARLADESLSIPAGESASTTLTVDVPDDADDGTYEHSVTATSGGDANVTASGTATVEVQRPGGFVNELDRRLEALGLGGLIPTIALIVVVLLLIAIVVAAVLRGRRERVDVDARWSEGDEPENGD